jgi:hypothetical protein
MLILPEELSASAKRTHEPANPGQYLGRNAFLSRTGNKLI